MERSLVVQAKGLEQALDKAALLLCCARDAIDYEILQEAKPGRYGEPGIPCKLRVSPMTKGPEAGEAKDGDGQEKNADFALPWSREELASLSCGAFVLAIEDALMREPEVSALAPAADVLGPPLEIAEDVSVQTGNIDHGGDVRISGSVRKGMKVTAAGRLFVVGNVETAQMEAGGDIAIGGGLLGTARSRNGSVVCKFAQGARIEAKQGNIKVVETAMHSFLHARRTVFVGDVLLGGECYGEEFVEVRIAGSSSGVPTVLTAGRNKRLMDDVETISRQTAQVTAERAPFTKLFHEMISVEKNKQALPLDERIRLWETTMQRVRLNARLADLSRQKAALLGMVNRERTARVQITVCAYPQVKVIVDDAPLEIKQMLQFGSFSKNYASGNLRVASYQ